MLPGAASQGSLEKNVTAYENQSEDTEATSIKGPMQFMFESEVDRIFSTPLGAWKMTDCLIDAWAKRLHFDPEFFFL